MTATGISLMHAGPNHAAFETGIDHCCALLLGLCVRALWWSMHTRLRVGHAYIIVARASQSRSSRAQAIAAAAAISALAAAAAGVRL